MREQTTNVDGGHLTELVVERSTEAVTAAVVKIVADIFGVGSQESTAVGQRIGCWRGLEGVNPARVIVIAESEQGAKLLVCAESLSRSARNLKEIAPVGYRCVSTQSQQRHVRPLRRALGDQIHRAADRVGILVGRQGLIKFDGLHEVRWNYVQLDDAGSFRRWHMDAINGHVAQPRLGAAYLDVFAFPFVPLQ